MSLVDKILQLERLHHIQLHSGVQKTLFLSPESMLELVVECDNNWNVKCDEIDEIRNDKLAGKETDKYWPDKCRALETTFYGMRIVINPSQPFPQVL